MINSIKILIRNNKYIKYNVLINPKKNTILINNHLLEEQSETINTIINMICTWDNDYGYTPNTEEFEISVDTEEVIEMIKGSGNYPEDYNYLLEELNKLYD